MRLLTKTEITTRTSSNKSDEIRRNILLAEEYQKKLKEINDIKGNLSSEKQKIKDDYDKYAFDYSQKRQAMAKEISELEAKRKTALEPIDNLFIEAEKTKMQAEKELVIIQEKETDLDVKERKLNKDIRFVDDKISELIKRELTVRELEKVINTELKKTTELSEKKIKEYEEFDKMRQEKTAEIMKAEAENEATKKSNKVVAEGLKQQQEKINKDRQHLESQIITFKQSYDRR